MRTQTSKQTKHRRHVHKRIRKKVAGTPERPRLNVYRSLNHIYVQLIDDLKGETLVSANSAEGKRASAAPGQRGRRQERGQEHRRARQGQGDRESLLTRRVHLSRTGQGPGRFRP